MAEVEQGQAAVESMIRSGIGGDASVLDLIIVGAGPAGISASLTAKKHGLNFLTLDQDTLGGTVFSFPRSKIVMTAPMDLPLHGKVKFYDTSKTELLSLWQSVLTNNNISIREKKNYRRFGDNDRDDDWNDRDHDRRDDNDHGNRF